jgi:hypothetical protein
VRNGKQTFMDRGLLPAGFGSLRAVSDRFAELQPGRTSRGTADKSLLLFASSRAATELEPAYDAEAESLQQQIKAVMAGDPDGAGAMPSGSTTATSARAAKPRRGRARGA